MRHYIKAVGSIAVFFIMLFAFLQETSLVALRFWLVHWINIESHTSVKESSTKSLGYLIGVYGALGLCQGFCIWVLVLLITIASYNASKRLHSQLLDTVVHCPMSFFETTPSGRILNRFTKDINNLDYQIPQNLSSLLVGGMAIVGVIYVVSFVTPFALIFFAVIAVVYFVIQVMFCLSFQIMIWRKGK